MFGLGTLINTAAIAGGGIIGMFAGKFVKDTHQEALCAASGVSTMFIAMAGAMSGMLSIGADGLTSGKSLLSVLCLVLGAVVGEIINLERLMERFGEWLKKKSGSGKDAKFVNAFLTSTFTVCIGAMAVVGSITDGLTGDFSILLTKSILDFVIILALASSLGKGCIFSAIPVFILQGSITLLAHLLQPLVTDTAMANLSLIGSMLIFCVGINLVWGQKIRVANLLPALVFAVAAAFLPFSL